MTIAVDFDGTIVRHAFPDIGKPVPFAIRTLLQLQEEGHRLILWSVREGKLLEDAVAYCREQGLEFYAVNQNYPEEKPREASSQACRKLSVDMFIDDRNVGGLPDWGLIYKMIHEHKTYEQCMQTMDERYEEETPSLWKRLFGR
ncbi:MAG: hypothetical protein HUK01_06720 [Bacteroidaceae bacterium]|nr:hypothetical protein [Bacteroidaceae bacterium]